MIDPTGIYTTKWEANKVAMLYYHGAEVLFANNKGEYFISLDETQTTETNN